MAFGGTPFLHPCKGALNGGDEKRLDGWKHFMFPRDYDIVKYIQRLEVTDGTCLLHS
jgi:hypothetical protein